MTWMTVAATGLLSGVSACVISALWFRYRELPRARKELERTLRERVDEGADVIAERVEAAVRRGVTEGFTGLARREVLEDTTRTIARTGAEFVEERLGRIFGRRGRGDQE